MRSPISYPKLSEVCERAARFHRLQVADRTTPFLLEQEVVGLANATPPSFRPDGWGKVGTVVDGFENLHLAVWWHPETDRIKLEKPRPVSFYAPEPPTQMGEPLYQTPRTSSRAFIRPFTALQGFIYMYEGREYSAGEAEELTADLGSIEGWTWRRLD